MSTRSVTLFAGPVVAGVNQIVYSCPSTNHTLVKSMYFTRVGGTVGPFTLKASRPGAALVVIFDTTSARAATVTSGEIWVVIEPGDQLLTDLTEGDGMLWISGALLPLPITPR